MELRLGDDRDIPVLLDMFDEAVAWMVARGNTEQWGTEPWSTQPRRVDRLRRMVARAELWIAEVDGEPVGAMIVGDHPEPDVPPVDEPELYVLLLLVSRRHAGKRIGARLLDHARGEARARGVGLLRLDSFAGGTGDLMRYYARNGFTPTERFTDGAWTGQVFEQRL